MSEWQALFIGSMGAAFLFGRPHWLIVAGMVLDLAATLAFAGDYMTVGAVDLMVALALIGAGRRGQIVALLFAMMQPIYVLGFAFNWPTDATYAIVELLAYAQLAVIGKLDVGISAIRRRLAPAVWNLVGRNNPGPAVKTTGGHAVTGVARISAEGPRK